MLRSCALAVKFALEMKARSPSLARSPSALAPLIEVDAAADVQLHARPVCRHERLLAGLTVTLEVPGESLV
jgi:hypothetical protein